MAEPVAQEGKDARLVELESLITEIQERVRARHPRSAPGDIPLPDLLPVLHARDAAYGKVAAIGRVNPRPGGAINAVVQWAKRAISRGLDWHVRDQVDFNRAVVSAVEALLGALEENNRALRELAARIPDLAPLDQELRDTSAQWIAFRSEWQRKLEINETRFLRGLADLQNAFQHRATLMEANYRDLIRSQHADFEGALERSSGGIQKKLWADLERIRLEYESLIHAELRLVRQRAFAALSAAPSTGPAPSAADAQPAIDYRKFAEKFRGPEEYVKEGQRIYVDHFRSCTAVLDAGCGRGEFLELMKDAGIPARGIDLSEELVAACRAKGLDGEKADFFEYLRAQPEASLDGIFSAQVVEHLASASVVEFVRLAHSRLRRGGALAIETPNPECLAIFARHFYLDPTHTRPIPPALLAFYVEEQGFGAIEVRRLSPAVESMPELESLPAGFRDAFFGALDYAVLARRLS